MKATDSRWTYVLSDEVKQDILDRSISIVQGDCLIKLREIERNFIDLVITDPPYFLDGLDTEWKKGKSTSKRATGTINGLPVGMKFDPKQGRELEKFIKEVGKCLLPIMKPGAFGVFFSQPRLSHRLAVGLEDVGFEMRDMFAWHFTYRSQFKAFSMDHFINKMDIPEEEKRLRKSETLNRKTPQLRPQFEAMILIQKPREGTFLENWRTYKTGLIDGKASLGGRAPSTVMSVEKPKKMDYNHHLTVKPVVLIEHLIQLFSCEGQVVLDPFLGSGTTAVACKRTKRKCIGIEINPEYTEIAEKRLEGSL